MKKKILKNLLALAIGGALSAAGGAAIDPDHLGASGKNLGKLAAQGALGGLVGIGALNVRAPKDDDEE